jgi:hypothetical protein
MIKKKPVHPRRKVFKDDELVCGCFKYTRRDIENDFLKNGQSTIFEKIRFEKKSGGCNCATQNPSGK